MSPFVRSPEAFRVATECAGNDFLLNPKTRQASASALRSRARGHMTESRRGRTEKPVSFATSARVRLGVAMRDLRHTSGLGVKEIANESGYSDAVISSVEHGRALPAEELVQYYGLRFNDDHLLESLYSAAIYERDQQQRRGHRQGGVVGPLADLKLALERRGGKRDSSKFVGEPTIPDGTLMEPGQRFIKTWEIYNNGELEWTDRYLTRIGPASAPGNQVSPSRVPIPHTRPGERRPISVPMRAPTVEGTSVSNWKMTWEDGVMCFPDKYQTGLQCTITTRVPNNPAFASPDTGNA